MLHLNQYLDLPCWTCDSGIEDLHDPVGMSAMAFPLYGPGRFHPSGPAGFLDWRVHL